MSSRDFGSSLIAPMLVEPGKDRYEMTFRMPKSSENSETAAESPPNPGNPAACRTHSQTKNPI